MTSGWRASELYGAFVDFITRQRGSAWQCYIGRWLCRGKHVFSTCRPEKTIRNYQTIFQHTWWRRGDLQAHLIWLRSVHGRRRYTVVKYYGFVTFVLPFFRFLISPTGRNYEPIRTFYGSKDVFCFVHVPFQGSKPSKSLLGGLRPPNTKFSTRFWMDLADLQRRSLLGSLRPKKHPKTQFSTRFLMDYPFAAKIAFSIRALESKLPLNVKVTP